MMTASVNNSISMQLKLIIPHFQMVEPLKLYLPELLKALEPLKNKVTIVVVDDGSEKAIQEEVLGLCNQLCGRYPQLGEPVLLPNNGGKGFAVRSAWADAGDTDYLGFIDADGSIPASAAAKFIEEALDKAEGTYCAMRPEASNRSRSLKRRFFGKLFISLVDYLLNLQLDDPQCGFKLVLASEYKVIEQCLKVDRFAFDTELLAYLQLVDSNIYEIEIPWEESPTSTIRLVWDGFRMFYDIIEIKSRLDRDLVELGV